MTFDDWMRARNPKYHPTCDTVALRELRDCWRTAEYHSERAQERELMIELMRDKCRKVGAGETANTQAPLQKLGSRLAELLDEDQFAECEEPLKLWPGVKPYNDRSNARP